MPPLSLNAVFEASGWSTLKKGNEPGGAQWGAHISRVVFAKADQRGGRGVDILQAKREGKTVVWGKEQRWDGKGRESERIPNASLHSIMGWGFFWTRGRATCKKTRRRGNMGG